MINDKNFYILGLPIDTSLGQCHFIKIRDFPQFALYQKLLLINKDCIINLLTNGNEQEIADLKRNATLFDLIKAIPEFNETYSEIFKLVFKKDVFPSRDNFDNIRKLIMEMNCIKEEEINPNPEIQAWIEKSKKAKQKEDNISFDDLVSSVKVYTGDTYEQILDMTIYQFYISFHRISAFKNYDTSTLFATVSSKKIDIENWCKHIDLFKKEKYGYTREEFNNITGGLFDK